MDSYPIRVIHVIPHLGHGGAEKLIVDLANYFSEKSIPVSILCPLKVGSFHVSNAKKILANVKLIFLSPLLTYPSAGARLFLLLHYILAPLIAFCIALNCKSSRFNSIVHLNLTYGSLLLPFIYLARACLRDRHTKIVYTFHSNFHLLKWYSRNLARFLWRFADKIIYEIDENEICYLKNLVHTSKVSYIPFGLYSKDYLTHKLAPQPRYTNPGKLIKLLWISRIRFHEKKLDLLLDTLRRLNDLQIHFQCHIYGDGEDVDILKSQVNSLALSDQVSILGYISNPSDILSDYDLYLCTSVNGNLGVGGMQALLSDIPVIGIDTLSAGNKPIYYSNNPVTLANYIQSLSFEVQLALYNEHLNSYRNSIISNGRLFNDRYLNLFQSLTSE